MSEDNKLAVALERTLQKAVAMEVKKQFAPFKAEIARLERALRASGARVVGGGRPGPKAGTRTAASAKLTPRSIKAIRKKLGLSQADFATLSGVTPVAVYFWESGRTKPRGASVEALVELRGMSVQQAQRRLAGD